MNEAIWSGDLTPLTRTLGKYLHRKQQVRILVDNLDKSWPGRGASEHELLVLRCLLEASRKLQKLLERQRAPFCTVVFIRNDIFERLVSDTPDRGKESYVSLDQGDHEVLRDILRRRAVASLGAPLTFDEFARRFFDLHVGGEDAFRFLFRHAFYRARDVLRLVKRSIETALNRGHMKVSEDVQLRDGTEAFAYEEQYNVERLLRRATMGGQEPLFVIHPAFRAALHVEGKPA